MADISPTPRRRGGRKRASQEQRQKIYVLCQKLGRKVPEVGTAQAAHATIENLKRALETQERMFPT